jgi:hypothetical protein
MKKQIFIGMTLICLCTIVIAKNKIPENVIKAFNQKFTGVSDVEWGKESTIEYEVEFIMNGHKHSANFSSTGEWLETESPISFEELPDKVKMAFKSGHDGANIKAISIIEIAANNIQYEIELKKFLRTVDLFYSAEGIPVKE